MNVHNKLEGPWKSHVGGYGRKPSVEQIKVLQ
jgi:hypothetical protein